MVREGPVDLYFGNNVSVCIMDDKAKSIGQPVCRFFCFVSKQVAGSASNGLLIAMLKSPTRNS